MKQPQQVKVYLDIVGTDSFEEVPWPDGYRIPCVGETYLVGAFEYVVVDIQWETEQGVDLFSVQIRVSEK